MNSQFQKPHKSCTHLDHHSLDFIPKKYTGTLQLTTSWQRTNTIIVCQQPSSSSSSSSCSLTSFLSSFTPLAPLPFVTFTPSRHKDTIQLTTHLFRSTATVNRLILSTAIKGCYCALLGPKILQPPAEATGSATSTKSGDENHFKVPRREESWFWTGSCGKSLDGWNRLKYIKIFFL